MSGRIGGKREEGKKKGGGGILISSRAICLQSLISSKADRLFRGASLVRARDCRRGKGKKGRGKGKERKNKKAADYRLYFSDIPIDVHPLVFEFRPSNIVDQTRVIQLGYRGGGGGEKRGEKRTEGQ